MKIGNIYLLSDTHIILRWETGHTDDVPIQYGHPFEPEAIIKALEELIEKIKARTG